MAHTSDFYLTQAANCVAEAEESSLIEVKNRNLRAAAAWQEMADKLLAAEKSRNERQAEADASRAALSCPD